MRIQELNYSQGNYVRNYRDTVRTQHHAAARPHWCGVRRRARRTWPRYRWAIEVPAQTNFARNFPRSFFETTRKRCNSNDADSRIELLTGELRAKLLIDSHNWATSNKTQEGAAHRHTQQPGPKAGPDGARATSNKTQEGAARHTQQPGPKAGPDGARHTSGVTSRPSSAGN